MTLKYLGFDSWGTALIPGTAPQKWNMQQKVEKLVLNFFLERWGHVFEINLSFRIVDVPSCLGSLKSETYLALQQAFPSPTPCNIQRQREEQPVPHSETCYSTEKKVNRPKSSFHPKIVSFSTLWKAETRANYSKEVQVQQRDLNKQEQDIKLSKLDHTLTFTILVGNIMNSFLLTVIRANPRSNRTRGHAWTHVRNIPQTNMLTPREYVSFFGQKNQKAFRKINAKSEAKEPYPSQVYYQ